MTFDAPAPGLLTISLSALRGNYAYLKSMTRADVAGVIKANAYGTGAKEAFRALYAAGCRRFFVATPEEGAAVRVLPGGEEAAVFILGGLYRAAEDFYAAHGLIPVLSGPDDAARWTAQAAKTLTRLPAAIQIDTGMNRLGFESPPRMESLAALDLKLVMTHFSCSDDKDHPATARQAAAFADVIKLYPGVPASLANSSGIFRSAGYHHDVVRPGYALYGGNPTPEAPNPMQPVAALSARVLQTRTAKQGSTSGYGEHYRFTRDTHTATIACGYADGFLRAANINRAKLYWMGQPCPVLGRVSMDAVIVDISGAPAPPAPGDVMEIIGPHQSVDDLAADLGTIGYEILTGLGPRYHRVYES